jgi:hypothetical protein
MRHPTEVRNELLREVTTALDRVRIRMSMYLADDLETLAHLDAHAQRFDLATDIVNFTLAKLGHVNKVPKDPRYDKTRRAAAKLRGKPPRGLKVGRPRKVTLAPHQTSPQSTQEPQGEAIGPLPATTAAG